MINNLLSSLFSATARRNRESASSGQAIPKPETAEQTKEAVPDVISKSPSIKVQELKKTWNLDDDIKALEMRFGQLQNGQTLEITLHELLELCPRTRRKSDAFKGLQSYLKAKGIVLRIIPNIKQHGTA